MGSYITTSFWDRVKIQTIFEVFWHTLFSQDSECLWVMLRGWTGEVLAFQYCLPKSKNKSRTHNTEGGRVCANGYSGYVNFQAGTGLWIITSFSIQTENFTEMGEDCQVCFHTTETNASGLRKEDARGRRYDCHLLLFILLSILNLSIIMFRAPFSACQVLWSLCLSLLPCDLHYNTLFKRS